MQDTPSNNVPSSRSFLFRCSAVLAAAGGVLIFGAAVIVLGSVLSRWLTGYTIYGVMEVVQIATAIGVSLFLPIAQLSGAHVSIDFFTAPLGDRSAVFLRAIASILTGIVLLVLAWRTTVGAIDMYSTGAQLMLLPVETWLCQAALVPGLFLGGLVAFIRPVPTQTSGEDVF